MTYQTVIEQLIGAARAATRCREAARSEVDQATASSLMRAADRYSARVTELSNELVGDRR